MNFEITNNEDDSIKVQIEFMVTDWLELNIIMNKIDDMGLIHE